MLDRYVVDFWRILESCGFFADIIKILYMLFFHPIQKFGLKIETIAATTVNCTDYAWRKGLKPLLEGANTKPSLWCRQLKDDSYHKSDKSGNRISFFYVWTMSSDKLYESAMKN